MCHQSNCSRKNCKNEDPAEYTGAHFLVVLKLLGSIPAVEKQIYNLL